VKSLGAIRIPPGCAGAKIRIVGTVIAISGVAAAASVAGGLISLARPPTTLFMSLAFGFASGVLIATVTLEMIPNALELGSLGGTAAGFTIGFLAVWLFELYIDRGQTAGNRAEQRRRVAAFHRSHRPRGDRATVLAGGTSAEELIEGLAIGTGVVIDPEVGLLIGAAIAIDNISEGMSIGELVFAGGATGRPARRRILGWTALIGTSLFVSSLVGWLVLRDAGDGLVGFLLAAGAGGMLYLTVTQLVPPAEERQYEGSAALATWAGFLVMLLLIESV
jgi:ZIP family zinc transporter